MPRFHFSSGPLAFTAGVELFIGRIRTQPGLSLRLAMFGIGPPFTISPDNRLRLVGPGLGDWSAVPIVVAPSCASEIPIYHVLPHDTEAEIYFTRAASTTNTLRLSGWHFR